MTRKSASHARQLSLYDGRQYLGRISVDEAGEIRAFNARGRRLGAFDDLKTAEDAIEAARGARKAAA